MAIIAAVVTGTYAIVASNNQIQAQNQQAQQKDEADKEAARKMFVRNQLQAAANTLLADSAQLSQAESDLLNTVSPPQPDLTSDTYTSRNDAVVDLSTKVDGEVAAVQLLGYDRTNATVANLRDYHDQIAVDLTDLQADSDDYGSALENIQGEIDRFSDVQGAVIAAVQQDIK